MNGSTTPAGWINEFNSAICASCGRIKGKNTSLDDAFARAAAIVDHISRQGAGLWWVGNGGSAALCSHLSQDAVNKLHVRSQPLTDAALLTCMANDYGYENVYAKPLGVLAHKGDALIAISSSGNSKNILECVRVARQKNMKVIALSGFSRQNRLWNETNDVAFYIPSNVYGLVETGHAMMLHALLDCLWLEKRNEVKDAKRSFRVLGVSAS